MVKFGSKKDEQRVVELIRYKARTRRNGVTIGPYTIARELNDEGFATRRGKSWTGQAVSNVLRDQKSEIRKPKTKRAKKAQLASHDYLTEEQVLLCRENIRDATENIVFEILLGSGLRASELAALEIRDVAVTNGQSQIDVRRGKGSKQRCVIIGAALAKKIGEYIKSYRKGSLKKEPLILNRRGNAISYDSVYYIVRCIGNRCGVNTLHPHALRHTFGVFLSNNQISLKTIQEQMGHASLATTGIYTKVFSNKKLEEMNRFEASLSSAVSLFGFQENTCKHVKKLQGREFTSSYV